MTNNPYLTAFKLSLPPFCCYFPLGILYGLLFTQQGLPWFYAPLFSAFIYAGAMQFVALTVLAAGESFLFLSLSLIPLGFRNVFYGLTMLERFQKMHPLLKAYLAHGLVDATYSILTTGPRFEGKNERRYLITLTVLIHLSWVLGTLLGVLADTWIVIPQGLGFALTAFFAATAVEQFMKKQDPRPIFISAGVIALALWITPHHLFLGGITMAVLACLALPNRAKERA